MGVACSFLGRCLAREPCLGHNYFMILSLLLGTSTYNLEFSSGGARVREVLWFSKATSSVLGSSQSRG